MQRKQDGTEDGTPEAPHMTVQQMMTYKNPQKQKTFYLTDMKNILEPEMPTQEVN